MQCAQSFQAGQHYWEVRASSHSVTLGVAYSELTRRRQGPHTDNIGRGPSSWGLCIQEDCTQAWHNGKAQRLPVVSGRLLGVDLNLASGCLTFYSLEPTTPPSWGATAAPPVLRLPRPWNCTLFLQCDHCRAK